MLGLFPGDHSESPTSASPVGWEDALTKGEVREASPSVPAPDEAGAVIKALWLCLASTLCLPFIVNSFLPLLSPSCFPFLVVNVPFGIQHYVLLVTLTKKIVGSLREKAVVSDSLQANRPQYARLLCQWNFSGNDTRLGCHFLFRGIFLTQWSNLCLLPCREILYPLSY